MNLRDFTSQLGSTSPTPGGGAAAGLSLALGAACVEKAVRFSMLDNQERFIEQFVFLREEGHLLCEKDQEAFKNWQLAKKLNKDTDEEKVIRTKTINCAAEECARIPLLTAEYAVKLLYTIDEFLPFCNKFLVSDASCGVSFAHAAFESSIFNIMINLPFIKNEIFKNQLESFIENNPDHFDLVSKRVLIECYKIIGK